MKPRKLTLLVLLTLAVAFATTATAQPAKPLVCHLPPGNPDNGHVLSVSEAALPAHLDHGDCLAASSASVGDACDCAAGPADVTLDVDPFDFLTHTSTRVRVQALVLPKPDLDPDSVVLLRTDLGDLQLCQLQDNGNLGNGDDVAGDSVFSCFVTFFEPDPVTIGLRAEAAVGAGSVSSAVVAVHVVDPLTAQEAALIAATQDAAQAIWEDKLAQLGDTQEARAAAAAEIATLVGVADAGVGPDETSIWIEYESGVEGGLVLNPDESRGGSPAEPRGAAAAESQSLSVPASAASPSPVQWSTSLAAPAAAEEGPPKVGNKRVLVWDAYNDKFAPKDEGPKVRDLYEASECPKFDVTYLADEECTVDSVKTFSSYGTVVMITHGSLDKDGRVIFQTRTSDEQANLVHNGIDLKLGRLVVKNDVIAVRPEFITLRTGKFDNALIYNGSCDSGSNSSLAKAFLDKGAKTYFGYTEDVLSSFASSSGEQLFTELVENHDNTGDAFDAVMPKVQPSPSPHFWRPSPVFVWFGDLELTYSEGLDNASFELGRLGPWKGSGDGRVVPSLGSVSPTDGQFMGLISTGLGFTTSSGLIEQSFCLPADATHVSFDWQYMSEELIEWCGPQHPFNDPFLVELETDAGSQVVFFQTVDTVCNDVTMTNLFFDQSGPGCNPTPGVGQGTGGNDCTVWSTGWQTEMVDVSALAAANGGKGVTLRFRSFDLGDSIFDTAVALDKVEVVTP